MKTIHYPNTIRSHLVTIVPMAPFTPKSTSKLRSALHVRYSIVIPRFISRAKRRTSDLDITGLRPPAAIRHVGLRMLCAF